MYEEFAESSRAPARSSVAAGLDLAQLAIYLASVGLGDGRKLEARPLSGGRSNLTFGLHVDGRELVLRRPPLGEVQATAHDMAREFRVQTALRDSGVPVPHTRALCEDSSVIGAPFYLMDFVDGEILRRGDEVLALPETERPGLGRELVEVLARLHTVDPRGVGLEEFGRPHGFLERQLRRWTKQFDGVQTRHVVGIDSLAAKLGRELPRQKQSALLHGDYRLDNCVTSGSAIVAVLDWEMSTLGDPLTDLALFIVYHDGLSDLPNPVVESPGRLAGFPLLSSLLEDYARLTGFDLENIDWYIGFAWFKLAVILEGVHYRAALGQTPDTGVDGVANLVGPCVTAGLAALHPRPRNH